MWAHRRVRVSCERAQRSAARSLALSLPKSSVRETLMRQLKSQRASATLHVEPLEIRVTPSGLTSQGRTAHEGIVTNSKRFLVTRVHNDRAKGAVGIMKVNALIGDGAHKKGWLAYDDWRTAYRVVPGLYPALRASIPSTRSDMTELLARRTRPRCGRRVV
jgi:hypothetical protein